MKKLLTTIVFVLALVSIGFSQSRTFVKTLDVKTATFSVDVPNSEVSVSTHSQNFVSFNLTIELVNGSESVLASLCKTTRYDVKVIEEVGNSVITIPNLSKTIAISGVKIIEKIKIEIKAPYGVIMNQNVNDKNTKEGI
jgi:hypothetical protein